MIWEEVFFGDVLLAKRVCVWGRREDGIKASCGTDIPYGSRLIRSEKRMVLLPIKQGPLQVDQMGR